MSLTGILDVLLDDPALAGARDLARAGSSGVLDLSAPAGAWPAVVASLATRRPGGAARPVLAVTATTREAEDLAEALRCFLPADEVVDFPSWETLPHERLSPRSDTVGRRLAVLRRLAHPDPQDATAGPVSVVVAPVRAVLQPLVKGLGDLEPVRLDAGDEAELEDVARRLAGAAYTRTDLVERRGEFALRGGILDVFPPTEEHPLRVEFWGDTVEEVRWFAVADQRSLEIAEHGLWAPPCRELLLTDEVRRRARELAPQLPGVTDLLDKVAEGIAVEGMESLTPALVGEGMQPLLDVLPEGTHVLLCDPERVRARAHDLIATSAEFLEASWANAAAGNATPIDLEGVLGAASFWSLADVREHAIDRGTPWWSVGPFAADAEIAARDETDVPALALGAREVDAYRGDSGRALEDVERWLGEAWRVVVVTEGHGLARRVVEVLGE